MKQGRSLVELAAEVMDRATSKQDFIAPVAKLKMDPSTGNLQVGDKALPVAGIAHSQLATYTGIPRDYYDRMRTDRPELLAANVNAWLGQLAERAKAGKPERRMVRTLRGEVRALLSDGYNNALENEVLLEAVLPVLQQRNLVIMSCEVTDRRLYLKAVDPSILRDVPTGRALGDGSHVFFDTVSPAVIISNSEVGFGRLSVETGVFTKVCTNLAMIGSNFKRRHVGSKADLLGEDVFEMLTDKTKALTAGAVMAQLRDVVASAFDAAKFEATAGLLAKAAEVRLPADDVVEVVAKVGRTYGIDEAARPSILKHLIEFGSLTQYGLHAAITRAAADVADYDKATEMERAGGEIITLNAAQFHRIAA
jgi:hypothetical protein